MEVVTIITNNLWVIAAICGNFWQESTVNPGIWENLTVDAPGFGLGQWTDNPPQVERRTALFNWLDANGYSHDSGDGQLQFLVHENLWIPSLIQPSAYNTLTDFFQSQSSNLTDLVEEFQFHWEGINDGTTATRVSAAQDFLYGFQNDDNTRMPWYTSNSYNTINYARWNSLRIMDFFLGTVPPTPPTPTPPTDEEIIAMLKVALKRRNKGGIVIVF